jgi:hypothetical protein
VEQVVPTSTHDNNYNTALAQIASRTPPSRISSCDSTVKTEYAPARFTGVIGCASHQLDCSVYQADFNGSRPLNEHQSGGCNGQDFPPTEFRCQPTDGQNQRQQPCSFETGNSWKYCSASAAPFSYVADLSSNELLGDCPLTTCGSCNTSPQQLDESVFTEIPPPLEVTVNPSTWSAGQTSFGVPKQFDDVCSSPSVFPPPPSIDEDVRYKELSSSYPNATGQTGNSLSSFKPTDYQYKKNRSNGQRQ